MTKKNSFSFFNLKKHYWQTITVLLLILVVGITFNLFFSQKTQKVEAQTPFSHPFAGGKGTKEDPYQIANVYQLQAMKDYLNSHFVLIKDIDASETKNWNNGQGFMPIGDSKTNSFRGSFDGKGYKIFNLYINRPERDFIGLFGTISSVFIREEVIVTNVSLANVNITGKNYVGGLVGYNTAGALISNSYSKGSVKGTNFVGGLVGINGPLALISNSYSSGSIKGDNNVGGLVGVNYGELHGEEGYISHSYSTASVEGNNNVGGLVGTNGWEGIISNSYSTGLVKGTDNVGGLVGMNTETISNSYFRGSVKGNKNVGGLVGQNNDKYTASISNSYSIAEVEGRNYVGGLVGWNGQEAFISKSYSISLVKGDKSVGGLVGWNNGGIISNSFWDIETSKITMSAGGIGKKNEEMKDIRTYTDVNFSKGLDSAWDFVGNPYDDKEGEGIWNWDKNRIINNGYPYLVVITPEEMKKEKIKIPSCPPTLFAGGEGIKEKPYQIKNLEQLQAMRHCLDSHFVLINDIDASETKNWNKGEGFMPIGDSKTNSFRGSFDGKGYKIFNLYINRAFTYYIGLFGAVGWRGSLTNVSLENVNITSDVNFYVGGLVGFNAGTISKSYSTGLVKGDKSVGGLVGENVGIISECYSKGSVKGNNYVGGLVGFQEGYYTFISNSYSLAIVKGNNFVGGLVGFNRRGVISRSYSTGLVKGDESSDGLVGLNEGGIISDSFWDIETSNTTTSDGGTGKTTKEMKDIRTFTDVNFSKGLDTPWDFVGNPYDDKGKEDIWHIDEKGIINEGYPFLVGIQPKEEVKDEVRKEEPKKEPEKKGILTKIIEVLKRIIEFVLNLFKF